MYRFWPLLLMLVGLGLMACEPVEPILPTPEPLPTAAPTATLAPTATSEPTSTPLPSPTPAPTATPEGQCNLTALNRAAAGVRSLDSYRFERSMAISEPGELQKRVMLLVRGSYDLSVGYIEAATIHTTFMPLSVDSTTTEVTETIAHEGKLYERVNGGEWAISDYTPPFMGSGDQFAAVVGWLKPELLDYLGARPCTQSEDTFDGQAAQRYEFTDLDPYDAEYGNTGLPDALTEFGALVSDTYTVWVVSVDSRAVPLQTEHRIVMDNDGAPIEIEDIDRMKDVNEPVEISAPTDATTQYEWVPLTELDPDSQQQVLDNLVPMMDDATIVLQTSDGLAYTTSHSVEEAVAYNEQVMTATGWTVFETFTTEAGLDGVTYTKDGQYIGIGVGVVSGETTVFIVYH